MKVCYAHYIVIALFLTGGCLSSPPLYLDIQVNDQFSQEGLDSCQVVLSRQFDPEKNDKIIIDTLQTNAEGKIIYQFAPEPGYLYHLEASRNFYWEALSEDGGQFLNQWELSDDDSQQIVLWLDPILPPEPDRFEKMHESVSIQDVLHTLKTNQWEWAFLPRLNWADIPILLTAGTDTSYVQAYPHHPQTRYQPDSVRVGLVALWLIEAIRKQQIREHDFVHLMPPSRAPVLGTRRGNPSGFNSIYQIETAATAYQSWWDQLIESGDTLKSARKNPLRGKGMSWM